METMYLVLENGRYFRGKSFGAEANETIGEVVFTTGLNGYLETITDPSYCGQIIVQTFPLIGNYGTIAAEFESRKPYLAGYVVREWCREPSNYQSEGDLDTFFRIKNIPALEGADTRALTRCLREFGTMNGLFTRQSPPYREETLERIRRHRLSRPVQLVASGKRSEYISPDARYHAAVWDFGAKQNIVRELLNRGCSVSVLPPSATAQEILAVQPDAVMLSNGPGDPEDNPEIIAELAKLFEVQLPIFGVCLGHQLMALARGAKTEKMKYGHRGANQPVVDRDSGRIYVTSQNHGYTVVSETLPPQARVRFVNANDGTCEGIAYEDTPAFSVQFHPEACPGPLDTRWLFDEFIERIKQSRR